MEQDYIIRRAQIKDAKEIYGGRRGDPESRILN